MSQSGTPYFPLGSIHKHFLQNAIECRALLDFNHNHTLGEPPSQNVVQRSGVCCLGAGVARHTVRERAAHWYCSSAVHSSSHRPGNKSRTMRVAEVGILALLVLSLLSSLVAVQHVAVAGIPAGCVWSSSNATYLSLVFFGALAWGFAMRHRQDRILGLWGNLSLSTTVCLPVAASLYFWVLTIGSFVLQPLRAVGLLDLGNKVDVLGAGSFLVQSLPSRMFCHTLIQHPTALLLSSVLIAFYLAITVVWAERVVPNRSADLYGLFPEDHSHIQTGHAAQSNPSLSSSSQASPNVPLTTSLRRSSSSLKTSSSAYTYTVSGSFTTQTSFAHLSANNSSSPTTSNTLYTGLSINKKLSNSPLLNPAPALRQLSLNVRNLSTSPIFAQTTSVASVTDDHNSRQADATSDNDERHLEANNTSDAAVSTDSQVAVKKADEVVEGDSSMPEKLASPISNSTYRWNHGRGGSVSEIEPVIIEVQAGAQTGGEELIPAVPARAWRSSSLKSAVNAILLPVRATKKSLASASFVRKQSLTRSTSSSPDPTFTPTPAAPRRTSSLKKTVSNLQNRLLPTGCLGKSAVRG